LMDVDDVLKGAISALVNGEEAGLLLSWFEFVEREARGCPDLLEGIGRLRPFFGDA